MANLFSCALVGILACTQPEDTLDHAWLHIFCGRFADSLCPPALVVSFHSPHYLCDGSAVGLTEEQLEKRRQGVGASEVPILAECDGYGRTRFWLYQTKMGAWESNDATEAMELGNLLEGPVLAYYAMKRGLKLHFPGTMKHPHFPRMFATPDGVVMDGDRPIRNVQCKVVDGRKAHLFGDEGTDQCPDHMRMQVEQEMEVLGVDETDLVVLIGGNEVRVLRIYRTPGLGEALAELIDQFWSEHVLPGIPPPFDGSDAADNWLDRAYRKLGQSPSGSLEVSALPVSLQDQMQAAAIKYRYVSYLESKIKRVKALCAQEMKAVIQQREQLVGNGWKATWKPETGRIDWKGLALSKGATEEEAEKGWRSPQQPVFRFYGNKMGKVSLSSPDGAAVIASLEATNEVAAAEEQEES